MIYALVVNNICVNTIVADEDFAATLTQYQHVVPCDGKTRYGVGLFYDSVSESFMDASEAIERGLVELG